jgi:hypothetical protein
MRLLFTALVWLVVAAHFVFLIYLPVGGLLALRWRGTIWLHAAAVAWAAASVLVHVPCPLTGIERLAREHAGMAPLGSAGFIDHYISGVGDHEAQAAALIVVAVSWVGYAASGYLRRPPESIGPLTRVR